MVNLIYLKGVDEVITTDKFYHGETKKAPFFEGWYFKHQIGDEVYAFIPGYSIGEQGEKCPFIQVINHESSEVFHFDREVFMASEDRLFVKIGENTFSEEGITLALRSPSLTIEGTISYGEFTPLKRSRYAPSIMGPFSYLSFMECYHGILSMKHSLKGSLSWNGQLIDFTNGIGYLEKDWGSSFPATYLWVQCNQFTGSDARFFFSAAEIPFLGFRFLGIISVLQVGEEEYRLSTYDGAKISEIFREEDHLIIRIQQKNIELEIQVLAKEGHALMAPQQGQMSRIIREKASTEMALIVRENKQEIFHQKGKAAGFEEVGNLQGHEY